MSNFLIVVDPDTEQRTHFVEKIRQHLSPMEGLFTESCSTGDFCAVWAANEKAPVSNMSNAEGAAVIWGLAMAEGEVEPVNAQKLRQAWSNPKVNLAPVFDGFYAATVFRSKCDLVVGADLLGAYPVYYFSMPNVVLVGSSPDLFVHHPAFCVQFNPAGLVGILLTMHIFDGQTLLRNVHRLNAGHLLLWNPEKGAEEFEHYVAPVSDRFFSLPFSVHVDKLDEALQSTVERHVSSEERHCLLLSGGLDSRMLGGYLQERKIEPLALTIGLPSDLEAKCAAPVARALGFQHRIQEIPAEKYPVYANLQAKWEQGAAGFNFIDKWGLVNILNDAAPRVITGYAMDGAIGTNWITSAMDSHSASMSFESFFCRVNAWGFQPALLKQLLRRDVFGNLVDETIEQMRSVYHSYSEHESQRAWCFNLYHRQRFHVMGAAWALSFGAWPVMPVLDRRILETSGAMPAATIAERRAQIELVCKRFPKLASLPVDRNSYNITPLRPRVRWLIAHGLYKRLVPPLIRRKITEYPGDERRYYYRTFDFNGPGWRKVRYIAEPNRERVYHLINRNELDKILPGPGISVKLRDGIIDASGLKSLIGFLLWSRQFF